MRKKKCLNGLNLGFMAAGVIAIMMTSCEGPAGPAGQDASATCIQCHNQNTVLKAKMDQYANSIHATGGHAERNDASCAVCHTHEGFIERLVSGEMTSSVPDNPTQPSCRTCHLIHNNYDSTDFALRKMEPVELWLNGETFDAGKGNLCANCHQPRIPSPMVTMGGGGISITSSRWGIHHGPQSALLAATGGYEIAGPESYGNGHPHYTQNPDGCITCHMATPVGSISGGHTMKMAYDDHGSLTYNVSGCVQCHSDKDEDEMNDYIKELHTEVEDLLDSLKTILVDNNILNGSTGLIKASSSSPLNLTEQQAGVLLNFLMIEEDRSGGIHNPKYALALLKNSIEAMQ